MNMQILTLNHFMPTCLPSVFLARVICEFARIYSGSVPCYQDTMIAVLADNLVSLLFLLLADNRVSLLFLLHLSDIFR